MRFVAKTVFLASVALALTACGRTDDGSNKLSNLVFFNSTEAPEITKSSTVAIYCPGVDVIDGGANMTTGRGQIALTDFARECHVREDGTVLVKVGVAGRVLLSSGSGGRYSAPVRFRIMGPDGKVLLQRNQTASVALGAGQSSGEFAVVQEGLVVPAAFVQNFDIEVGLGSGGGSRSRAPVADQEY